MKKCLDVSSHQGNIDWSKVKADGYDYVMIRAGWSWYEGGLDVDRLFHTNVSEALDAGMNVGVYIYSYDLSAEAAKTAAQKVLELVSPYKLRMPIAFDMEPDATRKSQLGREFTTEEAVSICKAFLDTIEKAGYYAILYSCASWLNTLLSNSALDKYDKWVAHFGVTKPNYNKPYGIWQYSSTGRVNGISGNVDLNYIYDDYPTIIETAGLNHLNDNETVSIKEYKKLMIELKALQANYDLLRGQYSILVREHNELLTTFEKIKELVK